MSYEDRVVGDWTDLRPTDVDEEGGEENRDVRAEIDDAVDDVLPAAPFGQEGSVLYRGGEIEFLNNDEFVDNTINGDHHDVWWTDMSLGERDKTREGSSMSFWRTKGVDNLSEFVTEHDELPVTGGLTDAIGTGVNFASSGVGQIGAVLYLEPENIPASIVQIRYKPEWFDNHPGVAAHIDDLSTGEVFVDGALWGLVQTSHGGDKFIQEWGEQARNKVTFNRFANEREVIAKTPEIDLDGSLMAVAGHYHLKTAVGGAAQTALAEFDGFVEAFARGDETAVSSLSDREVTKALWEETAGMLNYPSGDYWLVIRDDDRLEREAHQIPREKFKWAYNGSVGFVEDYDSVGLIVGKNRTMNV